jgi:hypothetical protein
MANFILAAFQGIQDFSHMTLRLSIGLEKGA